MMRKFRCFVSLGLLCACGGETGTIPTPDDTRGGASGADPVPGASAAPGDIQRSLRSSLQWKRYATFENDLAAALELDPKELCNEFGTEPCIRGVHLGPLGGHDIRTGLLESPPEPLVTTPTVVERVVLSACLARVAKEREQASPVFAGLALAGSAPAPGSSEARALVQSLVRRFLARDPSDDELEALTALAKEPAGAARSADSFATLACFAVGTSTEFLFF